MANIVLLTYTDGKRHGRGVYTFADGGKYDGEWHDGKRHGRGVMIYANGDMHDGEWRDDQPLSGTRSATKRRRDPENMCAVCYDAEATHGFLHADDVHMCVCAECHNKFSVNGPCPKCRRSIERLVRVFA